MAIPGCRAMRLAAPKRTFTSSSKIFCCDPFISISHFHRFARTADPKAIAAATHNDGACIIEGFYTPDQVRRFNTDIDTSMARLTPGRPDEGDEFVRIFHGNRTKRLTDLCRLSRTWREELIDDDVMHAVCAEAIGKKLGDYWLSTAQMIEIGPGSEEQPLHPDGAGWWPFWMMDKRAANEMLLNFLVAGTDTTTENGATCVIPGSHMFDYGDQVDPTFTEPPEMWREEDAVPVELNAGDCLLVGGRIVHRGGANRTRDERRRVLTATVVSSVFTPEEAGAVLMGREVAEGLSERAKEFVGFRERRPAGSIGLWTDARGMDKVLGF